MGLKKDPLTRCAPSTWNVQSVTDMSTVLFESNCDGANQPAIEWGKLTNGVSHDDINAWDVSGVTNMEGLFKGAAEFNLPLNGWNVAKVTNMIQMFDGAAKFNQPLSSWNVAKVTKTSEMFKGAVKFNQPLNSWNVAKVTLMNGMFANAGLFSQETNGRIDNMFKGATAMSDCNKKAIHNKFEAAPRSLNFDFDVATNTVLADRSDWKFPGLAC